jgi:hypothetical protein
MKKIFISIIALLVVLSLGSCLAERTSVNTLVDEPAGFLLGLWHGVLLPFSFVISLFKEEVAIYAIHNVGHLYDLGFVLGAGTFLGGSCTAGKRRWNRKKC